ncbi:hypothetical protein N7530_008866 [Penicillium desertorum]|uniref:Uncharacterized protein n=1 Tax=Penicillium desertorum TaxID=1303715 RepID=A0A9W9WQ42_9EURO|nr:hypothetical protein N7530_008866 [Penicillium desertorum]
MISCHEIRKRDPNAAELLLLLAHFDNRDIWYELIKSGCESSNVPSWLEKTVSSRLTFKICVKTLIGFSLLEAKKQGGSYMMHPVVQDWCIHLARTDENVKFTQLDGLALISVGYTVPNSGDRCYSELQQQLIPLANYVRRDVEAEDMCQRALAGKENALGPDHTSTLDTVNHLGVLSKDQRKLKKAEEMYQRALVGTEKALGPDHTSALYTGRFKETEEMYQPALVGMEKAWGKTREAEKMYQRALEGYEKALGPCHTSILKTVHNIALVCRDQGELEEEKEMCRRALAAYDKGRGTGRRRPGGL